MTEILKNSPEWRGSLSRRNLLRAVGLGMAAAAATPVQAADVNITTIQPLFSFAHVANGYGAGGDTWKTSFVFVEVQGAAARVRLLFYTQTGAALSLPLLGGGRATQPVIDIPAYGSAILELDETADPTVTGWAGVIMELGDVKGQGVFKRHNPGQTDNEAIVPLISRAQSGCILPFPALAAVRALPFDNTQNFVTALAFANTAIADRALDLEFRDETGSLIYTAHEPLPAHNQINFGTGSDTIPNFRYGILAGRKGSMRVLNPSPYLVTDVSIMGFRFSPAFSFTTWMPIVSL